MSTRFDDLSRAHRARERDFSERLGPRELWSIVEQFPLYAREDDLARAISVADLLRSTLDVPGNVAEFGSWQGANVVFLAKLLRIYDPHSLKRVHCFENFRGLTGFTDPDGIAAVKVPGAFAGSLEHLLEVVELHDLARELVVHVGDVEQTLPRALVRYPHLRFSFVYCDLHLHGPSAAALDAVHERVSPGGLVVLDSYGWDLRPGETVAAQEFLDRHGHAYLPERPPTSRPALALRRR